MSLTQRRVDALKGHYITIPLHNYIHYISSRACCNVQCGRMKLTTGKCIPKAMDESMGTKADCDSLSSSEEI